MRERLFEFHFKNGAVREGRGHDMTDAFNRLGLAAHTLDHHVDVTPRRRRTRLRLLDERKAVS